MSIKYDEVNGYWVAWHSERHPVTRVPYSRRRIRLKSESEAKKVERQLIVELNKMFHSTQVPNWKDMVDAYLTDAKTRGLSAHTVHDYQTGLYAHTVPSWGNRPIDSITSSEIRTLVTEKVGSKSPSHQKNIFKFIRAVFSFCIEQGRLNRNPTPKVKIRIGDKLKGVLTESQVRMLLEKAKLLGTEWYPHWTLALYTGMRNGELYALTWDKVNFENKQIKVDCAWDNKAGFKSTKSGDDRILEIAPQLLHVLRELKIRNGDSTFVLPRIDKWDKGEQARELRHFLIGIGLPAIRFHDLRATWATILLSKGIEPIKVMKMGGWKDMKTMMIYVRKAGVDIRGALDGLDLHNPSQEVAAVINLSGRS